MLKVFNVVKCILGRHNKTNILLRLISTLLVAVLVFAVSTRIADRVLKSERVVSIGVLT
jgi:hypothetical protein